MHPCTPAAHCINDMHTISGAESPVTGQHQLRRLHTQKGHQYDLIAVRTHLYDGSRYATGIHLSPAYSSSPVRSPIRLATARSLPHDHWHAPHTP